MSRVAPLPGRRVSASAPSTPVDSPPITPNGLIRKRQLVPEHSFSPLPHQSPIDSFHFVSSPLDPKRQRRFSSGPSDSPIQEEKKAAEVQYLAYPVDLIACIAEQGENLISMIRQSKRPISAAEAAELSRFEGTMELLKKIRRENKKKMKINQLNKKNMH